jgi:heterotetrameric sarcosine oxidase gamma subunit
MPEAQSDPMAKWTRAPDWTSARLERSGWRARPAPDLFQTLLTGKLDAALASFNPRPKSIGLWEIASAWSAIRIGRDRALVVGNRPAALATGWRADGWAASDASDAYRALDISGANLRSIIAEATSADMDAGSPSASILFVGVPALLYRLGHDEARLHVEASFAPHVWRWLETR